MLHWEQRSRDEPSGSKAIGLCLEVTCKPEFWSDPSKEFERKAKHHKRH